MALNNEARWLIKGDCRANACESGQNLALGSQGGEAEPGGTVAGIRRAWQNRRISQKQKRLTI